MKCRYCLKDKTINEFPNRNKLRCKKCRDEYRKEWGRKNAERQVVYRREYYLKRKKKISEYYKKWYRENGRKRDPLKQAAHSIVAHAIESGIIIKPKKCQECGGINKIQAHHVDYIKPLKVKWLCGPCHKRKHRKRK